MMIHEITVVEIAVLLLGIGVAGMLAAAVSLKERVTLLEGYLYELGVQVKNLRISAEEKS